MCTVTKVAQAFELATVYKLSSCFYQIAMNIEHIIPTKSTNRMFFVFGIATFWRVNYVTNLAPKN
jgi:hypothetical protein